MTQEDFETLARGAALSCPTRLLILRLVAECPSFISQIARVAGITQPTATSHVQKLEEAGLVRTRLSGRRKFVMAIEHPAWVGSRA